MASEIVTHVPVFLEAVMQAFSTHQGANAGEALIAFDGTFGRGGHTSAILRRWPNAKVLAFDWDQTAIDFGRQSFSEEIENGRLKLIRASYESLADALVGDPGLPQPFDLILLDLGVSSPQLDEAERGFSFYQDGPLDMRMDQRQETTAAKIVNTWDEQELAKLFIEYGEVSRPFRVVRAIVQDRKTRKEFTTTRELASMIERVDGWQKKGSHPATRYFLALRLKVNEELTTLQTSLPRLIDHLAPGGVLAVITFHSLEDRIVKNIFKERLDDGRLINKKVIKPDDDEVGKNPRARSAKLRAFMKLNLEHSLMSPKEEN